MRKIAQARQDVLEQQRDPGRLLCAVLAASAALTAPQPSWPSTTNSGVRRCTPAYCKRPHHLGRDDIARDTNDEQLAETGVEDQFGRHAGIAASEDGRVRALTLGECGEDLLLHGRKARFAADEAVVAGDQARERLVGRVPISHSVR